jgi:sugar phosphate isomerase/epimerase
MFRIGLNPYGLTYTVGLQGAGTPRANPAAIGMRGFIAVAREIGARCIELHGPWFAGMSEGDLDRLGGELLSLDMTPIVSHGLSQQPGETLGFPIRCARRLGAPIVRVGLSPVLEGARAQWGARWLEMARHARGILTAEAPRAAEAGVTIAIENHQDFGSEELVAMAEAAGPSVGIVFDTGNAFAVGEDPVAFARRAANRIRHVHLKDYRAQFTNEGYRLIRCAIGDGSVPFAEIVEVLRLHHASLTASIEPGALEARHIRLFADDWWPGYPPRQGHELGIAIGRLRRARLPDDQPFGTPWECGAAGSELVEYETAQIRQSAANLSRLKEGL